MQLYSTPTSPDDVMDYWQIVGRGRGGHAGCGRYGEMEMGGNCLQTEEEILSQPITNGDISPHH